MTEPSTKSASTRVSRIIKVPRKAVYQAFLDRDAVASWLPPETMTGRVHTFGPREGGAGRCVGRSDRSTVPNTEVQRTRFVIMAWDPSGIMRDDDARQAFLEDAIDFAKNR